MDGLASEYRHIVGYLGEIDVLIHVRSMILFHDLLIATCLYLLISRYYILDYDEYLPRDGVIGEFYEKKKKDGSDRRSVWSSISLFNVLLRLFFPSVF